MEHATFDDLIRALAGSSTRRRIGALLLGLGIGSSAGLQLLDVSETDAKKKHKNPKPNGFGCLDVGKACRGNGGLCCSGICEGKKPKKGKKDTSLCVAHHVGGCQAGEDFCLGSGFTCGAEGFCFRTTGNAGFCGIAGAPCRVCGRDADCALVYGPGAACVVCENACPGTGGTRCVVADA